MKPVIALLAAGLGIAAIALRCQLGIHRYRSQFVGDSWNPDAYVSACTRCGQEPS